MNRLEVLESIPAAPQGCRPWCVEHHEDVCNAADNGPVGLTWCPDDGLLIHLDDEQFTLDQAERLADAIRAQVARARAGRSS